MSKRSMARTLGLDPGAGSVKGEGLTGWSDGKYFGQLQADDLIAWMSKNLIKYDRVAIERFVTRQFTVEAERTLELVGAIKMLCQLWDVDYGMVNASDRKRTLPQVSDQIAGKHARDAEAVRLWDLQYGKW